METSTLSPTDVPIDSALPVQRYLFTLYIYNSAVQSVLCANFSCCYDSTAVGRKEFWEHQLSHQLKSQITQRYPFKGILLSVLSLLILLAMCINTLNSNGYECWKRQLSHQLTLPKTQRYPFKGIRYSLSVAEKPRSLSQGQRLNPDIYPLFVVYFYITQLSLLLNCHVQSTCLFQVLFESR